MSGTAQETLKPEQRRRPQRSAKQSLRPKFGNRSLQSCRSASRSPLSSPSRPPSALGCSSLQRRPT